MGGRTLDFLSQQLEEAIEKNAISFDNDTNFNLHGSGYALTFIFGKRYFIDSILSVIGVVSSAPIHFLHRSVADVQPGGSPVLRPARPVQLPR